MSVPFEASSHGKHWLFSSADELVRLRGKARERAIAILGEASFAGDQSAPPPPPPAEDEALLCANWEAKMQEICRSENARDAKRFTDRVLGAAHLYFKRFFLVISPMEESPLCVMLAALYLAGKVEEERIEVGRLVEISQGKLTHEKLLALEMRMLEALRFQLLTRSPFRCLAGLMQDLHAYLAGAPEGGGAALDGLDELRAAATERLRRALCADTPLLFTPLQMAISALLEADRARPAEAAAGVSSWMAQRFGEAVDGTTGGAMAHDTGRDGLLAVLERAERTTASALGQTIDLRAKPTRQRLKKADAQLESVHEAIGSVQQARREQARHEQQRAAADARRQARPPDGGADATPGPRDHAAAVVKSEPTTEHAPSASKVGAEDTPFVRPPVVKRKRPADDADGPGARAEGTTQVKREPTVKREL